MVIFLQTYQVWYFRPKTQLEIIGYYDRLLISIVSDYIYCYSFEYDTWFTYGKIYQKGSF